MKKITKVILGILLVLMIGVAIAWFGFLKPEPPPISPEDRAELQLMPLPTELALGKDKFLINSNFGIQFNGIETPRLKKAIDRFSHSLSRATAIEFGGGKSESILLNCQNKSLAYPSGEEDESYSLSIEKDKIELSANSELGVFHGLESLLQLVKQEDGEWHFPELKIIDNPRYPWRGLMIDVSRHWIPKEVILRNLDAMAAVKMNVLHLHLTDHQGFRIESKTYPKLHERGSNGQYFTQEDMKEIIAYASDRGIRVIPEFDLPGHSASWLVGYPELGSAPGPYELQSDMILGDPVLDPTRENVYAFLDQFLEEMASVFPDRYVHIGGDEVGPRHWNENPKIQEFMKNQSIGDIHGLQAYFNTRLQKIVEKHGKIMLGWDEILNPDLPKSGIAVQSWRNHKSLWEVARKGNKGILSTGYYLDHKQAADFHYKVDPEVIQGAISIDIDSTHWKSWHCTIILSEMDLEMEGDLYTFGEGDNLKGIMSFMGNSFGFTDAIIQEKLLKFSHEAQFGQMKYDLNLKGDSIIGETKISVFTIKIKGQKSGGSDMANGLPLPKFEKIEPLTPEQAKNILGGEACMWMELANEKTIESRIWPRAATIAEKLWSPKVLTDDSEDMYRRLMIIDGYLELRGLKHKVGSDELIQEMVDPKYQENLRTLVSVIQEDRFFNRMSIYDADLDTGTPFNRVVDAAPPESYAAYSFGKDVDTWLKSPDELGKSNLIKQLKIWQANHNGLAPAFEEVEHLKDVEMHSIHLSQLAALGLDALNNPKRLKANVSERKKLFETASKGYGGTVMNLVGPIQRLVRKAENNQQ